MSILNENLVTIDRKPQLLDILVYPNKTLLEKSNLVTVSIPDNRDLQDLLDDMEHTLVAYGAVGLAAIQVGVPLRMLVVRGPDGAVHKVINPVILGKSDEVIFDYEGCLSMPGIFVRMNRPAKVSVGYFDETGQYKILDHYDLLARAIIHEMEHLEGKMFIDNLSRPEKDKILRKAKIIRRRHKL